MDNITIGNNYYLSKQDYRENQKDFEKNLCWVPSVQPAHGHQVSNLLNHNLANETVSKIHCFDYRYF